jgi:hypothetical protein
MREKGEDMDVPAALELVLKAAEQHLFECATSSKKVQAQDLEYLAELGKALVYVRKEVNNGNLCHLSSRP